MQLLKSNKTKSIYVIIKNMIIEFNINKNIFDLIIFK